MSVDIGRGHEEASSPAVLHVPLPAPVLLREHGEVRGVLLRKTHAEDILLLCPGRREVRGGVRQVEAFIGTSFVLSSDVLILVLIVFVVLVILLVVIRGNLIVKEWC